MPRAQRAPSPASAVGRVCSRRDQPWLVAPGSHSQEAPGWKAQTQSTCWVSQGKPGERRRKHTQTGVLSGPPSVELPMPAPRCPASAGKTALGVGILDATLLLLVDHLGPPRKTLPLQQEGGSKKQSLGVGVCEPLTLRGREGGGLAPAGPAHGSTCASLREHVCPCGVVPRACTRGAHVLVRAGARVHACARVCPGRSMHPRAVPGAVCQSEGEGSCVRGLAWGRERGSQDLTV